MKLPISLLLLAAVGTAASKNTTERSSTSGQTSKRELLEGNFGQRTAAVLNKYESSKSTPRVPYSDDQQTQQEQSAAEQIFGTRVLPITKISDLLTGQGAPFDVALANQLYAPVSVYNARFQEQPEKDFPNVKFNQQKLLQQENNQQYNEDHTKKTLSRDHTFHIPGLLGSEFYTQETKYPLKLTKYVAATPDPRHFLYEQQSNINPYIPFEYYEQRPATQYPSQDLGFDYENSEGSPENKEQSPLRQVEPTSTPKAQDVQDRPSINVQGYHAHPNGAISYTSFLHNQARIDEPDSNLFKPPYKFRSHAIEPEPFYKNQFQVPEPPSHKHLSQDSKASPESEEQFRHFSQQQFSHGPFKSSFRFQSPDDSQNYHTFYLHPIRNRFVKFEPSLQSLENERLAIQPLPNAGAKLELLNQTYNNNSQELGVQVAPLNISTESQQSKLQDQPNTEGSIHSQQKYTPIPGTITQPQFVTPLYKNSETLEPGATNTPKSQPSNDLIVQPTTIQPETVSNSRIDVKDNHLSENSNLPQVSPTLENLSVSPLMSHSVSTLQPTEYYLSSTPQPETLTRDNQAHSYILPNHQVQIQQQELHEIHSAFEPQPQPQHLKKKILEFGRQFKETISQQSQSTTPPPTEPPKPDYEIEIDSHVDHSQLPKDLQPVTGPHVSNELVENPLIQPLPQNLQSLPLEQHQARVEQSQPHAALLQSLGEPPSYQNINYHDPNPFFFDHTLAAHPIQPQFYPQIPAYALQPRIQQSPTFPPVQYFGKYAHSIFGRV